jgi:hypothetical protein
MMLYKQYILLLALLGIAFTVAAQEGKPRRDKYYEKVLQEKDDLLEAFRFVIDSNFHQGFSKKMLWLSPKELEKKDLKKLFRKLHIKEIVVQGNTGYRTIAPEDSVIIFKRKYYSPFGSNDEVIYYAGHSAKTYPAVTRPGLVFTPLGNRMYYVRRK